MPMLYMNQADSGAHIHTSIHPYALLHLLVDKKREVFFSYACLLNSNILRCILSFMINN
jgi:hypothetical protein